MNMTHNLPEFRANKQVFIFVFYLLLHLTHITILHHFNYITKFNSSLVHHSEFTRFVIEIINRSQNLYQQEQLEQSESNHIEQHITMKIPFLPTSLVYLR